MNAEISAAAAGLSGAILLTHEAVMQQGVSRKKAYTITQAILVEAVVKMIDAMKEAQHD